MMDIDVQLWASVYTIAVGYDTAVDPCHMHV